VTDLKRKRGDSIELGVGPILMKNGQPQDLTGLILRFMAKDRLSDPDNAAVISGSTIDNRIVVTTPSSGEAEVIIPASVTAGLSLPGGLRRVLHWEVQVAGGDKAVTLDSGKLIIEAEVIQTAP
jgi:hypothetical protein